MGLHFTEKEANLYSPLTLAFLGDSVYELMVRSAIVERGNTPVKKLHSSKIELVCAFFQARAAELLMDRFTEKEHQIFLRGRNATGNTVPHSASPADYRKATGLESVFGYLHLTGNTGRLEELFTAIWNMQDEILQLKNKE